MQSVKVIFVKEKKSAEDLAERISALHKSSGNDVEVYFARPLWSDFMRLNRESRPKDNSEAYRVEGLLRERNLNFRALYTEPVIGYYFKG